MSDPSARDVARALVDLHGTTYAEEIGIDLREGTPGPLFRMLCAAILFSARISADIAVSAAKALADEGWTTSAKMRDSTWAERAKTLNQSGYARYDERTSAMLGEVADLMEERYGGDLRKLREEANRDPHEERQLLKEFKGMGDVGVDVFFREVQALWKELEPFVDRRAAEAASALGLPTDADELAELAPGDDVARLTAALTRVKLAGDYDFVRMMALTKEELAEQAAQKDIPGRSSMSKNDLARALLKQ